MILQNRPGDGSGFTTLGEENLADLESALRDGGYDVRIANIEDDTDRVGHAVVVHRPTFVFNLVDHVEGDNTQHSHIAALLELYGYVYTGSEPLALSTCQDRARVRLTLADAGVNAPGYAIVRDINAIPDTSFLRAPYIITQAFDDIYDDEGSRPLLNTREELEERARELATQFEMPLLTEEFLSGMRVQCIVLGNRVLEVLPLVAIDIDEDGERSRVIAQLSVDTADEVRMLARRTFRATGCRDFAQIDFVIDDLGSAYVIDVRPVIDFFAEFGVFRVAAEATELGFGGLLNQIARIAHRRLPESELEEWPLPVPLAERETARAAGDGEEPEAESEASAAEDDELVDDEDEDAYEDAYEDEEEDDDADDEREDDSESGERAS